MTDPLVIPKMKDTCDQCGATFENIGHPLYPGAIMQRRCKCVYELQQQGGISILSLKPEPPKPEPPRPIRYGAIMTVEGCFCPECEEKQPTLWGVTKHKPGCRAFGVESALAREALVLAKPDPGTETFGVWLTSCGEDQGWALHDDKDDNLVPCVLTRAKAFDLARHWRDDIGTCAEVRPYDANADPKKATPLDTFHGPIPE